MADKIEDHLLIRDRRPKEWFWMDSALYQEHDLPGTGEVKTFAAVLGPSALSVYNFLAHKSDWEKQTCFPSYPTISRHCGISEPTAISAIKKLLDHGLILREPRMEMREGMQTGDRTSNIYTLLGPDNWSLGGGKNILGPPQTGELPGTESVRKSRGGKNILGPQNVVGPKDILGHVVKNSSDGSPNSFRTGGKDNLGYLESVQQASTEQASIEQQQSVVVENEILTGLLAANVTRAKAERLVATDPEGCRRQLEYLPHRLGRKSAAATLVTAITENWAPPDQWLAAQQARDQAEATQERRRREDAARAEARRLENEQRATDERTNTQLDRMFDTLDPKQRSLIETQAKARLGILGRVAANESALAAMRRTLMREFLRALGAPEATEVTNVENG